jgi:hypothetical protein
MGLKLLVSYLHQKYYQQIENFLLNGENNGFRVKNQKIFIPVFTGTCFFDGSGIPEKSPVFKRRAKFSIC